MSLISPFLTTRLYFLTFTLNYTKPRNNGPSPSETSNISSPQISPPWSAPTPASSLTDLVTHYNNCLSYSLTTLAPLKTPHILTLLPGSPLSSASSKPQAINWSGCTKGLVSLYAAKCTWTTSIATRSPSPLPNLHMWRSQSCGHNIRGNEQRITFFSKWVI